MNVAVVTGFGGFIGSHFTRRLLELGWHIYGIDKQNWTQASEDFFNHANFETIGLDICDLKELPDCDYVFNFAAETHVGNSIQESSAFIHSNVKGVQNLLELIRNKPDNIVKKPVFFHISTDEVYGDRCGVNDWPAEEVDILNPSNPYSATKAAGDMLVLAWNKTFGLEYVIVRPTNNYGTFQHPEKLIPLTIKLTKWGKPIRLHNRGTPKRMWLHVEDTVDAILTLVYSNSRGIYNISGNLEQTNLLTVSKILMSMNIKNVEEMLDLDYVRPGQDMRYLVNDTKLKDLGWKPRRNFDDEIKKIVEWYLEDPALRLF